jgi:aryl-alcohol dehydrogenase-like predicted oxidoreductase
MEAFSMGTIEKQPFGNTGHLSTRAIFGAVCLSQANQDMADEVLEALLEYGINHIDVAPSYGDAELRVGPWMKQYREQFFLATKTDKLTYRDAREQFQRSLDRLQVDRVDLLQMHNLTDVVQREFALRPGGALDFLVEARDKSLVRYIGITGHGILAPKMHLQSLARFDFDAVLLPCNYLLMQNPKYCNDFNQLNSYCQERNIAVQTIKSPARGLWGDKPRSHNTWYEPLSDDEAILKAVQWVMGISGIFLITTGDIQVLPKFLAAAAGFQKSPSDEAMETMVAQQGMQPLFDQ